MLEIIAEIIKIRAERKAGGMLKEEIKLGGNPMLHDVTLKDLSIERIQSHRWQNITEKLMHGTIIPRRTLRGF